MSIIFTVLFLVSNKLPVLDLRGFVSLFFLLAILRVLLIIPSFIVHHNKTLFYFYSMWMTRSLLGVILLLLPLWSSISKSQFEMNGLGLLCHYLGIKVVYSSWDYLLPQKNYIFDILKCITLCDPSLIDSLYVYTPMELNLKLHKNDGDPLPQPTWYPKFVGALIYLSATWPNISRVVHSQSQFVTSIYYGLFFVYIVIFIESYLDLYSSLLILLSLFELTQMLVRQMILIVIIPPLFFVFFLGHLLFLA